MNPELLERVLSCQRLPSMPAVALRVIDLTQDQQVRLGDLAQVINNDQGLSAKILRTVNSSFYALRKPCTTINQAIVLMGLSAVKTLALGFSLVSSINANQSAGFDYQGYWRRSLLSGVAAKCFAHEAKAGKEEEAFLGGLLQDIGMVAMHIALGKDYERVLVMTNGDHRQLLKVELAELEVGHPEIGAMLAQRWRLPDDLVQPIRFHERPTAAPAEVMPTCQSVGVGNIACDVIQSAEPGVALKRLYTRAEEWLSVAPPRCDEVMKHVQHGAKEVARLLSMDIGQVRDAEEVQRRAADQLRQINLPLSPGADPGMLHAALLDEVTGLPSRAVFNQNVTVGFEQALVTGGTLCVAVLQPAGAQEAARLAAAGLDSYMRAVAERLAGPIAQAGGILCRFDERILAAMLPNRTRVQGTAALERVRQLGAQAPFRCEAPGLRPFEIAGGVGVGMACLDEQTRDKFQTPDALLEMAHKALDAAVRAGVGVMRVYAPKAA